MPRLREIELMHRKRSTPAALAKQFDLTMLEARFAWYHVLGLKGARAAREAGYSTKNAKKIAWAVSQRPRVQEAIKRVHLETDFHARITHELETGEPVRPLPDDSEPLEEMVHRLANSSAKWRKNFRLAGIPFARKK